MPRTMKGRASLLAAAVLATPLAGCISLAAPEKPIEINLNVKIEQEVLVRLQRDVEQIIQQNPQDFPFLRWQFGRGLEDEDDLLVGRDLELPAQPAPGGDGLILRLRKLFLGRCQPIMLAEIFA